MVSLEKISAIMRKKFPFLGKSGVKNKIIMFLISLISDVYCNTKVIGGAAVPHPADEDGDTYRV